MHVKGKNTTTKSRDPFKPKPSYKPNPDRLTDNGTLDTFLHRIRLESKTDNLTRAERKALKELTTNPHIVLNKADKGSTKVIEDREDYINNALAHLDDPHVYKPLSHDRSPTLKPNS